MARTKKGSVSPRFKVGDKIRVKPGVSDPDFTEMPLGGWSGTVTEIIEHEGKVNCVFEVDQRTLARIHPVYKQRCEIDGLDYRFMGMGQDDIEPDEGTPIPIDQPTAIVPRPLSLDNQEDRVRIAFGLTHDDPLPDVNHDALLAYHRYLSKSLTFPLKARYEKRIDWSKRVEMPLTVTGLLRPDECEIDEQYGIIATGQDPEERVDFPLAEVEIKGSSPSCRMVRDYAQWFHNER